MAAGQTLQRQEEQSGLGEAWEIFPKLKNEAKKIIPTKKIKIKFISHFNKGIIISKSGQS